MLQFNNIQETFDRVQQSRPDWLADVCRAQFRDYLANGLPARSHEQWRYTDLTGLSQHDFSIGQAQEASLDPSWLSTFRMDARDGHCLVFVDGFFRRDLSIIHPLPAGVVMTHMADAIVSASSRVQSWMQGETCNAENPLEQINLALMQDGLFLSIPDGMVEPMRIHLLFLTTQSDRPRMSHYRNTICVGQGSQLTLFEEYASLSEQVYFNNPVTDVFVNENANVGYYRLQREGRCGFHIANTRIHQQRNSRTAIHTTSLGGGLSRDDVRVRLMGVGAESVLKGLYLAGGEQHSAHYTHVEHAVPRCHSEECYKGILGGNSTAVFNGAVMVRPDAQQTDAHQLNKNLLLSRNAKVNTKPALEIYADDVKCTHGATVGQLDETALFYLRSRGIERSCAQGLLTYAFASEMLDGISDAWVRRYLTSHVRHGLAELSGNDGVTCHE